MKNVFMEIALKNLLTYITVRMFAFLIVNQINIVLLGHAFLKFKDVEAIVIVK